MLLLLLELLIKIGRILPLISVKFFSIALGYKSLDKDKAIWGAIFKNKEYASLATTLGLELVLFGTDL
jgi:hypothetical protein